ncbi:MAG: phthalate 4,5-dioxygenase oxygenase subunit [Candidatus Poriferisodalaceae bacterium]|jgi:phthalate 4,5-dioxygenase oxygenase subunit
MLTVEENDILTQVGSDTPMGRMMRRFWHPIAASEQVDADGDPLRTMLLGENFVVFRATDGTVGVLEEFCMHRRVSLALGRNEGGGLRCLFHGWKFAPDGEILETPNHCNERFRDKVRAPAYPCREAGGLIWTYIGPPELEPEFQQWGFFDGPDENRVVIRVDSDSNYLQLFEGGTDSSHVAILHSNQANPSWMEDEFTPIDEEFNPGAISVDDNAPVLDIQDTEYGYHYAAKRRGAQTDDGQDAYSIRVTPVILPTCRIIPAPSFQVYVFEIPQHDGRTSTYLVNHGPHPVPRSEFLRIFGLDDERFFDDETCQFETSWADGLGQDRPGMKDSWSGYKGIEQEDLIMSLSMGPIVDRSKETLVAADRAVVHLRRRMLESVRLHESGEEPIALELADLSTVQALCDTVIRTDENWQALVPGNMGTGEFLPEDDHDSHSPD